MSEKDRFVEDKLYRLCNEYDTIRDNYKIFEEDLKTYEYKMYTKALFAEIQDKVDRFIKENHLDINLYVTEYNSNIIILGLTITDHIAWMSIQSLKDNKWL